MISSFDWEFADNENMITTDEHSRRAKETKIHAVNTNIWEFNLNDLASSLNQSAG